MQNYRKSDYAINKNSPNIVYRFHNEIIEITLEDYLKENPDKTEHDFAELKALSDQIYYEQDRAESAQTRKDVSIHGLEETEHCATRALDEEWEAYFRLYHLRKYRRVRLWRRAQDATLFPALYVLDDILLTKDGIRIQIQRSSLSDQNYRCVPCPLFHLDKSVFLLGNLLSGCTQSQKMPFHIYRHMQ